MAAEPQGAPHGRGAAPGQESWVDLDELLDLGRQIIELTGGPLEEMRPPEALGGDAGRRRTDHAALLQESVQLPVPLHLRLGVAPPGAVNFGQTSSRGEGVVALGTTLGSEERNPLQEAPLGL